MTAALRRVPWLNISSVTLIVSGIVLAFIGHSTLRWSAPPLPPAWAAGNRQPPRVPPADRAHGILLARSDPVSIDIPSISVHARIVPLGLNPDGSVAVPPLSHAMETSWYDVAASVGPAVFYELGDLRPGARIFVRLRSGRTAIFETYSVVLYEKAKFPTRRVYGYTSWPTLRLITCGGVFDPKTGHYLGNIVAFASYVGSRR
jgi:hypothetical protein